MYFCFKHIGRNTQEFFYNAEALLDYYFHQLKQLERKSQVASGESEGGSLSKMMRKSSYQQPQQEAKQYKSPIPNLDEEARPYENEFQKRRLDIPNKVLRAPQTYWPLEEPGKVRRANLHQIKHNLFDERKFVNGQLGSMSTFLEDPTRLRTPLHDVSGEKTPLREFPWFES